MASTQFANAILPYPDCKEYRNLAIAQTFLWLFASLVTVFIAATFRKRGHTRSLAILAIFCFLLFVAGAVDWGRYKTGILCTCRARPSPIEPWALAFLLVAVAFLLGKSLTAQYLLSVLPVIGFIVTAIASHPFGGRITFALFTEASFLRAGTSGSVGIAGACFLILAALILIVYATVRAFQRSDRTLAILTLSALLLTLPMLSYSLARSRHARSFWTWCDGPVVDKFVLILLLPLLAVTMLLLAAISFNRSRFSTVSEKTSASTSDEALPAEPVTIQNTDPILVTTENTAPAPAPATRQTTAAPTPAVTRHSTAAPATVAKQSTAAPATVVKQSNAALTPATRQSTAAPAPATRQSTAAPAPAPVPVTRQSTAAAPPPA